MVQVNMGIAQLSCATLHPAPNIDQTVAAVGELAAMGSDVVVLPELAACGYSVDGRALRMYAEDVANPGPVLEAWSRAAAAHSVGLIGGFAEIDGGRIFNSAAVFAPDGTLQGVYRKLHLFAEENAAFTPGDRGLPVFEIQGLRVGVLICFDLRFPEATRILAVQGADVVVVPTAWIPGFDPEVIDGSQTIGQIEAAKVQASMNAIPIVCASYVGRHDGFGFLGRSVAVDALGREACGPLSAVDEALAVVKLDCASSLSSTRSRPGALSPLYNRRTDVYAELLGYTPSTHLSRLTIHERGDIP